MPRGHLEAKISNGELHGRVGAVYGVSEVSKPENFFRVARIPTEAPDMSGLCTSGLCMSKTLSMRCILWVTGKTVRLGES